ncbi:MAG: signal peptide peptidase SppA [Alphaproteobacteria bacterium]|jgi:protease-4|nr:signal peptide peptidase SppA [Alphaproteobacteria bacterium]
MRRFIVGILAIIGAITLLVFLGLFWSLHRMATPSLPLFTTENPVVLNLTLGDQSLPEQPHSGGFLSLVEGNPLSVHTIIEGIHHAAKDAHVKGILLTIENNASNIKISTIQEIRNALKDFKATGKFIYTYTDTFGELSNGTGAYYLAAATSEIWVMPLGDFNFNGMIVEVPFAKKALENFKIRPQMGRREDYKGMTESITESDFTTPYRQNMQRLLDGLTNQIVTDIAVDRSVAVEEVQKILDTSPHTLKEALAAKMIDEIGYKDQIKDAIEKRVGKKPAYYTFESYAQTLKPSSKGKKIAIIYATGTISKGKSTRNRFLDDAMMDAPEIAKNIREAGKDETIQAIILRIDSGGGNPIASEIIGREVERIKPKKPVIVSMANYAASGAYWIACNAHKIVAQPMTITGSIGVYAGKIVTQDFWDHYGIHWGEIHSGNNASIWSTGQEFSETGRQKFNLYLDKIYDIFQEKVAKGRNLTPEKVHEIAKGQVWTGVEAKENGLIDALGGLMTAIEIAKQEAGIATDAPVTLLHLPAEKSFMDLIFDRARNNEAEIFACYPSLRLILQRLGGVFTSPQVELKVDEVKL